MAPLTFSPATKERAYARIALAGPAGSGKTYTALVTASALGQNIALIDTEHKSSVKYAKKFNFQISPLDRYDPQVLIEGLGVAAAGGFDVVIVDSLTHFWSGVDGVLEQVEKASKRTGGNSFGGWKEVRPLERRMIEALLAYPGHVIVTLRTKTEWVIEENERGRKVPRKVGTKAEQREGLDYEFDIVGDLNVENELVITKSRCEVLSGAVIAKPDADFGRTVLHWLEDGESSGPTVAELREQALNPNATREDLGALYRRVQRLFLLGAPVVDAEGNGTTLGELIAARGRSASPAAEAA